MTDLTEIGAELRRQQVTIADAAIALRHEAIKRMAARADRHAAVIARCQEDRRQFARRLGLLWGVAAILLIVGDLVARHL